MNKSFFTKLALPVLVCLLLVATDTHGMGYCFDAGFHDDTNRLFITAGTEGMHVFDVADGKLDFVTTIYDAGYYRNLKILGDRAYMADVKRGLVVFDITKRVPVVIWKGRDANGMGIYIQANYAYLAVGTEGLQIFDISTPDSPNLVSKCKTNGEAWDVWVSGRYAYVADVQKGVTVVDVSSPSSPQKVSLVTWDENNPMAEIVRGEGKFVYVAAGKHGLVVVDVNNPLHPKVVSKYKSGPGGYGEGLCVKDNYVYLSNGNRTTADENGLIIVDAHNPASLKVKGKCTFPDWVEGVCLAGKYLFLTNTGSGVRSIDVSDPNNPRLVDSFPRPWDNPFLKSEISQQESQVLGYFEKVKQEILDGRKFTDQSSPANAFLTLFSAIRHQDTSLLERVSPRIKPIKEQITPQVLQEQFLQKQFDLLKRSVVCRFADGNKSPKEQNYSAIYIGSLPDKKISQVLMFGYIDGSWRFLGMTGLRLDLRQSAKQAEAVTRNALQK